MVSKTVSLETIPLDTVSLSCQDFPGEASGSDLVTRLTSSKSVALEPVSHSARSILVAAAKSAAGQSVEKATTGFGEARRYTQQNPDSVRALSFCIAMALFIFSILGVLNVFNALFKPYQYLFALYNIIFAAVIIVADGDRTWFMKYWDAQEKLFGAAAFLATQSGRAAFYFYVGSINLFMLPENWLWKFIYLGLGGVLCLNGALMLLDSIGFCCRRQKDFQQDSLSDKLDSV
jgi:hypothetical protein